MKRILIPAVCAATLLTTLLTFTACTTVTESPTPTTSPIPTETATVTPSPTGTPSITPSPTVTETPLPSPEFTEVTIGNDFLFESSSDACQLPCWQGLNIGVSGKAEIQEVFDSVFGFKGTRDIFRHNTQVSTIPDLIVIRNVWNSIGEQGESFEVLVLVEEDTYVLRGFSFFWTSGAIGECYSAQRIIENLGRPLLVMASIHRTQVANFGQMDLLMIYENGVSFFLHYGIDIQNIPSDENIEESSVRFCLTQNSYVGHIFITEPFEDGLSSLTSLQSDIIETTINEYELLPINEVFSVTEHEVTQQVQQSGEACLYTEIPYY